MQRKNFKILKICPPFTKMLVTAHTYTEEECISENGLLEKDQVGMLRDIQEVIAVGSAVRDSKPGDLVQIDFSKYMKKQYHKDETKADMPDEYYNSVVSFEVPTFEVNGETTLLIDSDKVFFKIEEYKIEVSDVGAQSKKLVC